MEARYVAVYKLLGVSGGPGTPDCELVKLSHLNARAFITYSAESHCLHIDRELAIRILMAKGFAGQLPAGNAKSRATAELENVKADRKKKTGDGAFLVFEVTKEIRDPVFRTCRDLGDFVFCFDAFPKMDFIAGFRTQVNGALAATTIALGQELSANVQEVGHCAYLVESESGKPIYSISATPSMAAVSIRGPLTEDVLTFARKNAKALCKDERLTSVARLLIQSLETTTDDLRSFLAAWAGLEIFINKVFKQKYEGVLLDKLRSGAPASAKPYLERIKLVMKDKYRLADKFLAVASALDETSADTDFVEFQALKGVRDDLLHGQKANKFGLPTEKVQTMLRKYLRLHIQGGQ